MSIRIPPKKILQIGLALTFFYAGYSTLLAPESWIHYVPLFISDYTEPLTFLKGLAIFQVSLSVFIITGLFLTFASFLGFLQLLFNVMILGLNDVTFKDFGLMMATAALFFLSLEQKNVNSQQTEYLRD